MTPQTLARAVMRYLQDCGRPIAVYVGPDNTIGYSETAVARDEMPMRLAGTYDERSSEDQIAADLQAAGMR